MTSCAPFLGGRLEPTRALPARNNRKARWGTFLIPHSTPNAPVRSRPTSEVITTPRLSWRGILWPNIRGQAAFYLTFDKIEGVSLAHHAMPRVI